MAPSEALRPAGTDSLTVAVVTGPQVALHPFYESLGFRVSGPSLVMGARRHRCASPHGSIKIDALEPEPAGRAGGEQPGYQAILLPPDLVPSPGVSTDPRGNAVQLAPADQALGVVVGAREPDRLADWYENAGCARISGREAGFGRSLIRFVSAPGERAAPGRASTGIRYVTLGVADVDAAAEVLVRSGGVAVIDATTLGPVRFAIVADPEGNWIEVGARVTGERGAPPSR